MSIWPAVQAAEIFATMCFGAAAVVLAIYRRKIGRFEILIFPMTITFLTFLSYATWAGSGNDWLRTSLSLSMWSSWLLTVYYLLWNINKKRRLF